jgi:hypothetical protein
MANVMYAHADAWQAEIDRLQAVITAMAEQESADNATLRELLLQCRSAIDQVPEKKVFGIGGRGSTHWYLADELVANIDAAITSQSEVKPWSRWRLC